MSGDERAGVDAAWLPRLFDSTEDVQIVERRLPHWSQAGTIAFITFRAHDSMPKEVLERWFADRARWLRAHGVDPDDPHWTQALGKLDPQAVRAFLDAFWNRWHDALDDGHGECVLREPELAAIVAQSLRWFDGERYLLLDAVVMPNHVHVLCSFRDETAMLAQCESWKRFAATAINRVRNRKGRFWQKDAFDHLVRSEGQFEFLRRYIAANPAKAGVREGEFWWYSRTSNERPP